MSLPIYMVSNRYKALNNESIVSHKDAVKYCNIRENLTPALLESYITSNASTSNIRSNYLSFIDGLSRLCENHVTTESSYSQINHMVDYIGENVIPSLRPNELEKMSSKIRSSNIITEGIYKLQSYIDNMDTCDRVLNNDSKLSNRFNFDKITNGSTNTSKIVREMCKLIDTYNIKETVKMNVALENICYSLYKNKKYDQPSIVMEVVDYFMTREPVIPDYKYKGYRNILKRNIFLDESSIKTVERLLDEDHIYFIDMINSLKSLTENKDIHNAINLLPKINTEDRAGKYINALAELYEDCYYDTDRMIITNILNGLPLFTNICHDFVNTYMDILNDRYSLKGAFVNDNTLVKQATSLEEIYKKTNSSKPSTSSNGTLLEEFLYDQNKSNDKFHTIINNMTHSEKMKYLPSIVRYEAELYHDEDFVYFIEEMVSDCTSTYPMDQIDDILTPAIDELHPSIENFKKNTLPMYKDAVDVDFSENTQELEDLMYGMRVCEVFDKVVKESKIDIINTINSFIPYIISDEEAMKEFMNVVALCPHIVSLEEIAEMNKNVPQNVIESTNLKNSTLYAVNETVLFEDEKDVAYDLNIELEAVAFLLSLNEENIIDKAKSAGKEFVNKTKESVKKIKDEGLKGFNMNNFKLAMKGFWAKVKKLSVKEKQFCQNLDATTSKLYESIRNSMTTDRREMLIKGQVVPSFSKCVKNAIALAGVIGAGTALAGGISSLPVVAPIVLLGAFATNKRLNDKEKLMLYDELDTELKVLEKELAIAENEGDMNKYRFLLNYQKRIIREKQRIKYHLKPRDGAMSRSLH